MTDEPKVHAAESTHYYDRDGKPVYETKSADGKKMVSVNVGHARKQNLVPGFSEVANCAAKPQLTDWLVMQGILSSLTLPRRPHEPDAEYIKRVVADSKEQGQKAAERGTAIHAAIDEFYSKGAVSDEFAPFVNGVTNAIDKHFGRRTWHAEGSFAHKLGYGGRVDLRSPNDRILIDFKTREFSEVPVRPYDNECMQGAAYITGLGWPLEDSTFCNVYVSRTVPGLVHIHVWEREDLERGWGMFEGLLRYWRHQKRYDPSWQ